MPLEPSWGEEGDKRITEALGGMFDYADHDKAGVLKSAHGSCALAKTLATRLHKSFEDEKTITEAFTKESWTSYACQQINASTYDAATDTVEKLLEVLKSTILSKKEYEIFQSDFAACDLDHDGFLNYDEVKAMLQKQLEREPSPSEVETFLAGFDRNHDGKVSFDEYLTKLCGVWNVTGLGEEEAMEGFLKDLEKVPVDVARAGLAEGDYKDNKEELKGLSDAEVMSAYKKQSLAVWATMTDDPEHQGEMLADVMDKLEAMGPAAAQVKEMLSSVPPAQ